MRTIWRLLIRTIFWSYERGTWPYDVAVLLIVVFVLLSPRSWFHDRPPMESPSRDMVQLYDDDPADGIEVYRVNARLLANSGRTPEFELELKLHEAMRQNVQNLQQSKFRIVRIEPVRERGSITYYDVSITP